MEYHLSPASPRGLNLDRSREVEYKTEAGAYIISNNNSEFADHTHIFPTFLVLQVLGGHLEGLTKAKHSRLKYNRSQQSLVQIAALIVINISNKGLLQCLVHT